MNRIGDVFAEGDELRVRVEGLSHSGQSVPANRLLFSLNSELIVPNNA